MCKWSREGCKQPQPPACLSPYADEQGHGEFSASLKISIAIAGANFKYTLHHQSDDRHKKALGLCDEEACSSDEDDDLYCRMQAGEVVHKFTINIQFLFWNWDVLDHSFNKPSGCPSEQAKKKIKENKLNR
jgi:hypothetical protein